MAAKNSALPSQEYILNYNSISQHYCFYYILDQINAALVNIIHFFQKYLNGI